MERLKLDRFTTVEQKIDEYLKENKEEVLYRLEVVPLDYTVNDFSTPEFILTRKHLIFKYDMEIEVWDIIKVEVEYLGDPPKFSLWQQLLEGNVQYTLENYENFKTFKEYENLFKISLSENNGTPKDFLLRKGMQISRSYQTWAMGKVIEQISSYEGKFERRSINEINEMLHGNFSQFNKFIFLFFIFIFIIYLALKIVSGMILPEIVSSVLNWSFAGILVGAIIWIFRSQENNNKRFLRTYNKFQKK